MIIDRTADALTRIWCLFELFQTCKRQRENHPQFRGLYLCTAEGVLNDGEAGVETAASIAEQLVDLKVEQAKASNEDDRLMILKLIEDSVGFDEMNKFIKDHVSQALDACHQNTERKFRSLRAKLMP